MLSRPFRGMPRIRLVLLLIVLLMLEAGAGFGLYHNHQASAESTATGSATPTDNSSHLGTVGSFPALLLAGRSATFSLRIASLGNTSVTYSVKYADGTEQSGTAQSDVSGFSSHSFVLKYLARNQKEQVTVVVSSKSTVVASTPFSILLPIQRPK